jgi:hypothetical protein
VAAKNQLITKSVGKEPAQRCYEIATTEGLWSVHGWSLPINPHLAYRLRYLEPEEMSWTVDHIPSGLSVSQRAKLTKEQAVGLILLIGHLDWSDRDEARKHGPVVYEAMDTLKIDYGRGIRIAEGESVHIDLTKMKDGESVTFRFR